jgi:hypothetical protein
MKCVPHLSTPVAEMEGNARSSKECHFQVMAPLFVVISLLAAEEER